MSAILACITHPEKNPVIRYNDRFTSRPTATSSPNEWVDSRAKPDSIITTLVGQGGITAFAFRDALRANIHYDPNTALLPIQYDLQFQDAVTTDVEGAAPAPTVDIECIPGITDIQVAYLEASSTYQPHGPFLYVGVDYELPDKRSYFWIDEGERFFVSCTDIDMVCQIELNRWMPSEVQEKAFSITLSNAFKGDKEKEKALQANTGLETFPELQVSDAGDDTPKNKKDDNNNTGPSSTGPRPTIPIHRDRRSIARYHKDLLKHPDCHSTAQWVMRRKGARPEAEVLEGNIQVTVAGYYSIAVNTLTEGLITAFQASVGLVADGASKPDRKSVV